MPEVGVLAERELQIRLGVHLELRREGQRLVVDLAAGRGAGRAGEVHHLGVVVGEVVGQGQRFGDPGGDVALETLGGHGPGVDQAGDQGAVDRVGEVRLEVVEVGLEHRQVRLEAALEQLGLDAALVGVRCLGVQGRGVGGLHVEEDVVRRTLVAVRIGEIGVDGRREVVLQPEAVGVAGLAGVALGEEVRADPRHRHGRGRGPVGLKVQLIEHVPEPDDGAELRGEVDVRFTEEGEVVAVGAVGVDAGRGRQPPAEAMVITRL